MQRLSLAVTLVLAACGASSPPPAAPRAEVVTLKELQNGDRACYVVVESAAGEQSIEGDFELCAGGAHDATALVDKPVTYATKRANVQAASCEGNPDCADSDEVELVISISPAP